MLCGRSEQLAAIDRLLEGMRRGRAGALVPFTYCGWMLTRRTRSLNAGPRP